MLFYSVKVIGIYHQHHEAINMKFVRFTKIICVRNSWCIVRTLNALMHALNTLMHALLMHHDVCVDARADARVNAHAMQFTWIRMRCSLRECAYDAVYVFAKSAKPVKPSLLNPNNHYRFQMIMLTETWFKSVSQLIVSSKIISLDLADEIFCWWIGLKIYLYSRKVSGIDLFNYDYD